MSWLRRDEGEIEGAARSTFEAGRKPGEKHWEDLTEDQRAAWREYVEHGRPAI